jgi:NAD(P)-dependent dehydrogenase (short-subunit alcohol dehydrogenase family)
MVSSDLTGKLALVTGGAKEVGMAIAERFAQRGAEVIVNFSHSLDVSKQTATELRELGARVNVIRASVAQKHQVDSMFDEIEAKYGRLDILVNNAAWGALLGVGDIPEQHFDHAIDTNLKGAFWCSRRAAALMARAGGGAVVNISSAGNTLLPANQLVVGTSNAALESLTRYLAAEYAPRQIRVNTVSATLIDGDMADMFRDPENINKSSIAAPQLGRSSSADHVVDLVTFLASDAARWITGQVFVADGGLSPCHGLSPRRECAAAPVAPASPLAAEPPAPSPQPMAPSTLAELPDINEITVVGAGMALPRTNGLRRSRRPLLDWTARVVSVVLQALYRGRIPPQDHYAAAARDFTALMRQLPERHCEELTARRPRPRPRSAPVALCANPPPQN